MNTGIYTVKATDAGGLKDSMKLIIISVTITQPTANDVFLHGSKCSFKAVLSPASVSVDDWDWAILEGDGSPTSGDADVYQPTVLNEDEDYNTPDDFKAKVTATVRGVNVSNDLKIRVVFPRIEEIDFASVKPVILETTWSANNPEWTWTNRDNSRSVFVRNTKLNLSAKFKTILPLTNATDIQQLYADCDAWTTGDPDCKSQPEIQTVSGTETIITMEGVEPLPDEIYAYNNTSIWGDDIVAYDWSYTIEGNEYTIDPDEDDNIHHVYVTFGVPAVTDVYETILHITCGAASGENIEKEAVEKIWSKFKSLSLSRIDGTPLFYYKNGYTSIGWSTDYLLINADGRCGAWGRFFYDCLKTHSINSMLKGFIPSNASDTGFLVNNWNFSKHIRKGVNNICDSALEGDDLLIGASPPSDISPNVCIAPGKNMIIDSTLKEDDELSSDGVSNDPNYPYVVYKSANFAKTGPSYGDEYGDIYNIDGLPGQGGNPEPPEIFGDHCIIEYDGNLFDPSYGNGSYANAEDYENSAIPGYVANWSWPNPGKPKARKNLSGVEIDIIDVPY